MDTLAGIVARLLGEEQLPQPLYVYGVADYGADIYLDDDFPRARHIADFLRKNTTYSVRSALPTGPANRPAVALGPAVREYAQRDRIAQILLFLLLIINDKVNCVYEAPLGTAWTPAHGDIFLDEQGQRRAVYQVRRGQILDFDNRHHELETTQPVHPDQLGQYVRGLVDTTIRGRVLAVTDGFARVQLRADEHWGETPAGRRQNTLVRVQDLVINDEN